MTRHRQVFHSLLFLTSLLLVFASVGPQSAAAQKEILSPTKTVVIIPPSQRPSLDVTSAFEEPSGNDTLDVAEQGTLRLTIANQGGGPARNLEVWVALDTPDAGVRVGEDGAPTRSDSIRVGQIGVINRSGTQTIDVPIAAVETPSGRPVELSVDVRERYGFGPSPHAVVVPTETYRAPALALAGFDVEGRDDQVIRADSTAKVRLVIQNAGKGPARDVRARVKVEKGGALMSDASTEAELGTIQTGGEASLPLALAANRGAMSVVLTVALRSAVGPYQTVERLELPVKVPDQRPLVDRDIPKTNIKREHAVAVVIGVQNYQDRDVPNVKYAVEDAKTVRKYVESTLGFRPGNIIYEENPTQSKMNRIFGTSSSHKGQLYNYLRSDTTEVFVFYSGHGAPNQEEGGRTYFVPSDGAPNQLQFTGYPVDQLYSNLAKMTSGPVTVAIDACFSGQSDGGVLIDNASPALMNVENPMVGMKQGIVLSAGKADQISSWYPEKNHGLFTYFFLKGLRGEADENDNGAITGREMKTYLDEQVPYWARRLHNRTQTPEVVGQGGNRVLVRFSNASQEADEGSEEDASGSESGRK